MATFAGYKQVKTARPGKGRPARPKAPKRIVVKDPLAPLTDAQLRAQTSSLVNQQIGPQTADAQRIASQRSAEGTAAIQGYTSQFVNNLQGYADRAKAAFGQAEQGQAASSEALRNLLTGAGNNLSADLSNKLQAIGAPTGAQTAIAGGAAATATGAANAGYAQGTNNLQSLQAQGANQQGYSAALPGVAVLQGQRDVRDLQSQISSQLSDKIASLNAEGQQLYVSLYTHFLDNEFQKALARQSGQFKNAQAQSDAAYKSAQIAFKKADLAWKRGNAAANRSEKAREADQRTQTTRQTARERAQTSRENSRRSQRGQNSRQNKWQTNPDGSIKWRRNKITGKRERIPLRPARGGGSTNSATGVPNH